MYLSFCLAHRTVVDRNRMIIKDNHNDASLERERIEVDSGCWCILILKSFWTEDSALATMSIPWLNSVLLYGRNAL